MLLHDHTEELVKLVRAYMHETGCHRSCINCYAFDEAREQCTLVWKRPPARIIATGCENWDEDLPF